MNTSEYEIAFLPLPNRDDLSTVHPSSSNERNMLYVLFWNDFNFMCSVWIVLHLAQKCLSGAFIGSTVLYNGEVCLTVPY